MSMEITTTDTASSNQLYAEIYALEDNVGDETGFIDYETDDARPRISGQATPYSLVTIYDYDSNDGTIKPIGTVQVDGTGQWSFLPTDPLSDGLHDLFVTASNASGTSEPGGDMVVSINTDAGSGPAPVVTIDSVFDNTGSVPGYVQPVTTTDDTTPTLPGSAIPNSLVSITDGTTVLGTAQADDKGFWSFEAQLDQGAHHLTAVSEGTASPAFDFAVATSLPTVAITSVYDNVGSSQGYLKPGDNTDDNTLRLQGNANNYGLITILDGDTLLGTCVAYPGQDWLFDTPPLGQGEHHLKALWSDGTGSDPVSSEVFDVSVTVATPPPTVAITSVYDDVGSSQGYLMPGDTTDDNTLRLRGSADSYGLITILDGDTLLGTCVAYPGQDWFFDTPPLGQGEHHLKAVWSDGTGSDPVSSEVFDVSVTVATPPPTVAITSVYDDVGSSQGYLKPGDTTDDSTLRLTGSAEKYGPITILDGDTLLGTFTAYPGQEWFFDTPPLGEGEHHLRAVWNYGTGYAESSGIFDISIADLPPVPVAPPVILYAIDTVGPEIGRIRNEGTTDDGRLTLYGRGAKDTWLSIKVDGHEIGTVKTDGSGNWHFKPDAPMDTGQHTITASLADGTVGDNGTFVVTVVPAAVAHGVTEVASAGDASAEPTGLEHNHDPAIKHVPDIQAENASTAASPHEQLSLNDVFSAREGDLLAADRDHDGIRLNLPEVETVAPDRDLSSDAPIVTQDISAFNANLVLPHDQPYMHAVM